jgi:hypothetical protein
MIVAEVRLHCIQKTLLTRLICGVLSDGAARQFYAPHCLTALSQVLQEEFVQNFQGFSNNYPVLGKCVCSKQLSPQFLRARSRGDLPM